MIPAGRTRWAWGAGLGIVGTQINTAEATNGCMDDPNDMCSEVNNCLRITSTYLVFNTLISNKSAL